MVAGITVTRTSPARRWSGAWRLVREKGWDRSSFYARTRAAAGRIALYLNNRLLDPISR
jgi:hypothetical protein